MSGGSYNYLCYADSLNSLTEKYNELDSMFKRLLELNYDDAARETMELLLYIKQVEIKAGLMYDRLKDVWHSVEWHDSGDSGKEEIEKAIKEYRKEDG